MLENLGKRSIPSDQAAVRIVIQKPNVRGKRIPSWISKLFFALFLKRLHDATDTLPTHSARSQISKIFLKRPNSKTPDSVGAKLYLAEREAEITKSPLDTDGERQCVSQMQNWTMCLACQKKTCALSQCCH